MYNHAIESETSPTAQPEVGATELARRFYAGRYGEIVASHDAGEAPARHGDLRLDLCLGQQFLDLRGNADDLALRPAVVDDLLGTTLDLRIAALSAMGCV